VWRLQSSHHDYYSIWFNFTANWFLSEENVWVIKLNSHYFISASFRNVVLFGISNTNLQNGISNTSTLKKAIGIWNTNWYLKYQLVLQIPIGTWSADWYFNYQLVLRIPWVTINQHEEQQQQQQQQSGYKSRASTPCSRLKMNYLPTVQSAV
jgi:hypothetical protein